MQTTSINNLWFMEWKMFFFMFCRHKNKKKVAVCERLLDSCYMCTNDIQKNEENCYIIDMIWNQKKIQMDIEIFLFSWTFFFVGLDFLASTEFWLDWKFRFVRKTIFHVHSFEGLLANIVKSKYLFSNC